MVNNKKMMDNYKLEEPKMKKVIQISRKKKEKYLNRINKDQEPKKL